MLEPEGFRTALPHPLAPGDSCLVEMNVTAPSTAGRYLFAPDLVHSTSGGFNASLAGGDAGHNARRCTQ